MSWGKPVGNGVILRGWDIGEKALIQRLMGLGLLDEGWKFVPVGHNIFHFDLPFTIVRAKILGLVDWEADEILSYFYNKPAIDIKPIVVLLNKGEFKGANLRTFTTKKRKGVEVTELYQQKKYEEILSYIEEETTAFLGLYQQLRKELGNLGDRVTASLSQSP
jgi:hypothetical protein